MKILAIRGKNLASLDGQFEIDFRIEPLKSAGLFAITGSTGSGKSTILDALCLALFDDTPRFRNATSDNIVDTSGKLVNQRSSANVLRRGTGEGYAEVEFIALNGNSYRSRWSVKRAREKSDGNLQETSIVLINTTDGTPCQGTKKELLLKITELIGLSFSQFTRAVLLAQGDFATFMKAKDNEKAEILEKLTGTDIYTRISARIYEKWRDSRDKYLRDKEIIDNINILEDEPLQLLKLKLHDCKCQLEQETQREKIVAKKLDWIKINNRLQIEIKDSAANLLQAKLKLEEAEPRHKSLTMINKAQEIRDEYNHKENLSKQLINTINLLETKRIDGKRIDEQFKEALKTCDEIEQKLAKISQEYESASPTIVEARAFDIQIDQVSKNVDLAKKEVKALEKKDADLKTFICELQNNIDDGNKKLEAIATWFDKRQKNVSIINKYDLVVSVLDNYQTAKNQIVLSENSLTKNKQGLKAKSDDLELLNSQSADLNDKLSEEVILLRKKLVDGEPCPVCGSIHHQLYHEMAANGLKMHEEELNRQRKALKDKIEKVGSEILKDEKEILRLETMIKEYQLQEKNSETELNEYLNSIPDWKELNSNAKLKDALDQLVKMWSDRMEEQQKITKQLLEFSSKLQNETANKENIIKDIANKKAQLSEFEQELALLNTKRKAIFDGKRANDVEKHYKDGINELTTQRNEKQSVKANLNDKRNSIFGEIAQMETNRKQFEEELRKHDEEIKKWIISTNGAINLDSLKDLLSKTATWIEQERNKLNELKEIAIAMEATFKEKERKFEQHQQEEYRELDQNITVSILEDEIALLTEKIKELSETVSNIESELKADSTNREAVAKLIEKLNTQKVIKENWDKLNELLGSATGDKFKKIAQGYTLDSLLAFANQHLEELSKRYKLQRIVNENNEGLGLQVVDNYSFGDIRSVHSLSGGESFLISLALALGLSSLSSNKMSIESLFIDEGFGSLDIDTLRVAMSALEHLQTQGRKIGVISHVQEMTEQMRVKIKVQKVANGRSKVEIIENEQLEPA